MENFVKARNASKINSKELTTLLNDDQGLFEKFLEVCSILEKNPNLAPNVYPHEMSKQDQYSWNIRRDLAHKKAFPDIKVPEDYPRWDLVPHSRSLGSVGLVMVVPAIEIMGTDAQIKLWVKKIKSGEWITAYAQTELAHGSDVQS